MEKYSYDAEKLEKQLEYVLEKSAFYKNKFGSMSAKDAVKSFEELPFTYKSEILKDQEAFPPYGSNLCVGVEQLCRIHKTSGTTNKPVIIALTKNDVKNVLKVGKNCFETSGLRQSDTVVHCLNYNMWAGGLTDHLSLEETGATVIPFGVGHSENLLQTMIDLDVTAIHCTPSYLSKLEEILDKEFQKKPKDLGLRLGLLGAESGLQNPNFRHKIENDWGFKAMNANYGMSEVLSMVASECELQTGLHFRADEFIYVEIIDENGKSLPVEKGTTGELIFTNLDKEAQPLIRYRTGDVVRVTEEKCKCGYSGMLFEIIGRSDDMIVVKGLNVFVSAIEKVLQEHLDVIATEYRILVNKTDPIEDIVIQVEGLEHDLEKNFVIEKMLKNELRNKININCEIQILSKDTLQRTEGKTKHLLRIL